jgi:hypothetical protein
MSLALRDELVELSFVKDNTVLLSLGVPRHDNQMELPSTTEMGALWVHQGLNSVARKWQLQTIYRWPSSWCPLREEDKHWIVTVLTTKRLSRKFSGEIGHIIQSWNNISGQHLIWVTMIGSRYRFLINHEHGVPAILTLIRQICPYEMVDSTTEASCEISDKTRKQDQKIHNELLYQRVQSHRLITKIYWHECIVRMPGQTSLSVLFDVFTYATISVGYSINPVRWYPTKKGLECHG